MRTLLGLAELVIQVWGVIAFWGTPWSIVTLVILALDILVATYAVGKQQANAKVAKEVVDNLFKENKSEEPEEKESVFSSFFKNKKDNND